LCFTESHGIHNCASSTRSSLPRHCSMARKPHGTTNAHRPHITVTPSTDSYASIKRARTNWMASSHERLHHYVMGQCSLHPSDPSMSGSTRSWTTPHLTYHPSTLRILH
jgi:hypothetical protein